MDAPTAALLGATVGMLGQLAVAWLTRRKECAAWLRNQRASLYTNMLVWTLEMRRWLNGDPRLGPSLSKPPPLPGPPPAEYLAEVYLIGTDNAFLRWRTLTEGDQNLRAAGPDLSTLSDESRNEIYRRLDEFDVAARIDPMFISPVRRTILRVRRLLRRALAKAGRATAWLPPRGPQ
jgi:hypothetical protein